MKSDVWKMLLLALAATPVAWISIVLLLTIFGALDDSLTNIQIAGHWWIASIPSYILALSYFLISSRFRKNRERKKAVDALVLYFQEQMEKHGHKQPSDKNIETIHEMFMERVKVWALFDPEIWSKYYPNEKYSKYLFGIADNLINEFTK